MCFTCNFVIGCFIAESKNSQNWSWSLVSNEVVNKSHQKKALFMGGLSSGSQVVNQLHNQLAHTWIEIQPVPAEMAKF